MCKHRTYNSNLFQYSAPKMSKLKEIRSLLQVILKYPKVKSITPPY